MKETINPRFAVAIVVVMVLIIGYFGYRMFAPARKTAPPPEAAQMIERQRQGMGGFMGGQGRGGAPSMSPGGRPPGMGGGAMPPGMSGAMPSQGPPGYRP